MRAKVPYRICRLVLVAAYAAATLVAAASPLAACPALDHTPHAGHSHGDEKHRHHHGGSGSSPGDCLKCCIGTCALGVSLPVPFNGASSLAFDGTRVVYAFEQPILGDRSIRPDPGPPKPIT